MKTQYKGFKALFPTRIHKFQIDKALIKDITAKPKHFEYFNVKNEPAFMDLQQEVEKCIFDIRPVSTCTDQWKVVTAWLNNQPPNEEGFIWHNHIDSFYSAVLYLKGSNMSLDLRDEPKEAINTGSAKRDFEIVVRHTWNEDVNIDVEVGDLLFFPSYCLHKPHKNETQENRISIAYNLMPSRYNADDRFPWCMDYQP